MDVEEVLIDCVREERILYDRSDKKYMDIKLKTQVWRNIATKCGMNSGDAAKAMWKKLRDCYRASRKRKSSSSAASIAIPWKHEVQMSFLQPFMRDRRRITNSSSEQEDVPLQVETESPEMIWSDDEILPLRPEKRITQTPSSLEKADKSMFGFLRQEAKKREQRSNRREEIRRSILEQDDPLKSFFDSMYGTTKSLPLHLQRRIKKSIFSIISEAEEEAEEFRYSSESSSTPVHRHSKYRRTSS